MLVADLAVDEGNPRTITPEAKAALAKSIERFGIVQPIVWNERTETVVGGHQRLGVLREMGVEQVEVVIVDLSLEDERALNIALNSDEISGDWDLEALTERLEALGPALEGDFVGLRLDELQREIEFLQAEDERAEPKPKVEDEGESVMIGELVFSVERWLFEELSRILLEQWERDVSHTDTFEKIIVEGLRQFIGEEVEGGDGE